ncbi:MAG: sigma-70 family RNA polymerase sigma factor [Acidobacteriia bacterium]|nr:sigma-70 family RNA polymerase sigma factor [Terriglobia bacterium]
MSYFGEVDLGSSFQPFTTCREQFGFVPKLFRAQTLLPRLIEAEGALISAILFTDKALARIQKECILLVLAAAQANDYCFSLHYQTLKLLGITEQRLDRIVADYPRADLSPTTAALLTLVLNLGTKQAIQEASSQGLSDESIFEAILTAGLSRFLCTLAADIGAVPDFAVRATLSEQSTIMRDANPGGPFLQAPELPEDYAPFVFLGEQFGTVPKVFHAQGLRPDVLEAQVYAIRSLLLPEDALSRAQKHDILRDGADLEELRGRGFTEAQLLEAVVTASFAGFFDILQTGLGTESHFVAKKGSKKVHLSPPEPRHTAATLSIDPDADTVARVQKGDLDAFEELMIRHNQRVYRTLVSILGNPDDARDAMQDTFLKAFQHMGGFEGRSKFSTWLVSIATNTGIQRLRERRPMESLDESGPDDEGFRPRQIQAWTDDPEQLYSQAEMRSLIENGVMKLPVKYRMVLMLRDIEQLPIEEAASALGLGIPAIKARLLRGRLMLREALAPHFIPSERKGNAQGVTN